jgi:hypothetical protein
MQQATGSLAEETQFEGDFMDGILAGPAFEENILTANRRDTFYATRLIDESSSPIMRPSEPIRGN